MATMGVNYPAGLRCAQRFALGIPSLNRAQVTHQRFRGRHRLAIAVPAVRAAAFCARHQRTLRRTFEI
jgi:hypothetical protein